ncbi:MAG: Methyltransferase type 11 [Candidatus Woesebacteria bacterium GW2011_GWB1_38_5b]|uniref:Methyltransferase type 11 n=1 Tax=Candidatus Woesebacteria bacterium GW2011_GWB1_38_5b TaxID=1618569 RepID=A0A0G0K7R8_9BACT|nr:MAG: Methyltransferase type 11 [Candidatus Woesebacteria bacterium GW2011_GWB1_38_5b]
MQKYWEKDDYYDKAHEASLHDHEAMRLLFKLAKTRKRVVDLGCGEGTRLELVRAKGNFSKAIGVDISPLAIKRASRKHKAIKFIKADLRKLPIQSSFADLVFSAFVLEHTVDTEEIISEAVRITSKKGDIVFVAPNYGSPNRSSPPFSGSRIRKFLGGVIKDFASLFYKSQELGWARVEPLIRDYKMDFDVTIEPYLRTLLEYLRSRECKIVWYSSCWAEELLGARFHQKVFKFLGKSGVFPFKYWGPHLLVHAKKI